VRGFTSGVPGANHHDIELFIEVPHPKLSPWLIFLVANH
jgi:hypothetical protein